METRCQIVLGQIPQMGNRRSPLVHHPPWYVSTCHWGGVEGGREVHSMRPPAEPSKAGPRGRWTSHKTCRIPDLPQRDQRPLPWCILAEKVTQSTTLWAPVERKRQSGTSCPLWGTTCIGGAAPPHPKRMHERLLQNPSLGPGGGKTHMMRPSEKPERLTSRHWRLPTCWNVTPRG